VGRRDQRVDERLAVDSTGSPTVALACAERGVGEPNELAVAGKVGHGGDRCGSADVTAQLERHVDVAFAGRHARARDFQAPLRGLHRSGSQK